MDFNLNGDIKDLTQGIDAIKERYGFDISDNGIPVTVKQCGTDINVSFESGKAVINYPKKSCFFRALGLLKEHLDKSNDNFKIHEAPQFDMNGAMFDNSRNAVFKTESIKKIISYMAVMGLDTLMLYTEDTYEIKEEPYFGYMRSKYTYDELKEIDDYAYMFGIEVIPCIQTLAHLEQFLKWDTSGELKDNEEIMLVGSEKTYKVIDEMIRTSSAPLRSKRIHIGMDEAMGLGLGSYLAKHGYRESFDIMTEHLKKVVEITDKYGLRPMMWSDMFFRLGSKIGDYYDPDVKISEDAAKYIPDGMQLVYWDYYHNDKETYKKFISEHKKFGQNPVFAGGIWTWEGFCTNYEKTFTITDAGLSACKEEGVREVVATMWKDDGTEDNDFSVMLGLQLYAEHGFNKTVDVEKLKERFKFCTGASYDSFFDLSKLDHLPGMKNDNFCPPNPAKFLLWQDPLIGLFDKYVENMDLSDYYADLKKLYDKYMKENKKWSIVFGVPKMLSSVLSIKSYIGVRIKKAYDAGDKSTLDSILNNDLPELIKRVKELKDIHRDQWFATYKPLGFEVLDIKYGGLIARIETAIKRLQDYLSGKVEHIEELEQQRLYFEQQDEGKSSPNLPHANQHYRIVTGNLFFFH